MNEGLAILSVIAIIAFGIVSIIKVITEYKLKRRLIDKAEVNEGFSTALEESMKSISSRVEENRYPALKWGLVFFFVGTGLIVLHFMEFNYQSSLPFGMLSACAALGFLIYYFLMKKELKKPE
ncbi:MAG: hypothetical protein MI975_19795 [Cytophagales bacterium]|nr:hypothetical protein [Cytophagales bacterium]